MSDRDPLVKAERMEGLPQIRVDVRDINRFETKLYLSFDEARSLVDQLEGILHFSASTSISDKASLAR